MTKESWLFGLCRVKVEMKVERRAVLDVGKYGTPTIDTFMVACTTKLRRGVCPKHKAAGKQE